MPAELVNEIFAEMTFKDACNLLAKMPNVFLARNVKKLVQSFKKVLVFYKLSINFFQALKLNTWNLEEHSSLLTISEDGLTIIHSGLTGI